MVLSIPSAVRRSGHRPALTIPAQTVKGLEVAPYPDMDAFDTFATDLVQRYCGKVKYYEPWNEPNGPRFGMAQTSSCFNQPACFKDCERPSKLRVYRRELFAEWRRQLWDTEVSWREDSNLPDSSQAAWAMRYHAAEALAGISRVVWYAYYRCACGTLWTSPLCGATGEPVGQVTPGGVAYGTTANWLIGANITHCKQYEDGLWACELQRADGYDAWMLWNASGSTSSVPVPGKLGLTTYRDWQNNTSALPMQLTVTDLPVLLEP